ncbi:histone H1-like [Salvia divinorum]|uniref:Histone H1-like n=1 Tax=Salvia divinorum TaxID=28513 RepID=A0ABD1H174_SALDI
MATTEEPILSNEPEVEPPATADTTEETARDEKPTEKSATVKKVSAPKEAKKKKVPAPRNRSSSHPPYFEMIKDAIVTLKDRTGSSQYAITKFIEDKEKNLPANFRKVLLVQLKKLVANEKLAKVKNSFKLPSARSPKPVPAVAAPTKKKPATAAKLKSKAAAAKENISAVKPKPKPKTAAAKPKTAAAKPKTVAAKPAVKDKPAAKPKAAAPAKAKAKAKVASKRKAPEITKKPPAKATRTSTRTNPGRKTTTIDVIKKAPVAKKSTPVKKAPSKSVKAKTVKSPSKKATVGKKGKK